jgi:hypothetical protein
MRTKIAVGAMCLALTIGYFATQPPVVHGQQQAAMPGCSGGTWTPAAVDLEQDDPLKPTDPAFHTVYGYACGGIIYSVRFSSKDPEVKIIGARQLSNRPI